MRLVPFALIALAWFAPAAAERPSIAIDIASAERLLEIACSGDAIDEAEFASSSLLRTQLAHHREFGPQFTLENYLAGLRSIARCEAPDPDPFRFSALVERREDMVEAIAYLAQRHEEIGERVAEILEPYMPADLVFDGQAVLAGASFSCGGFSRDGVFFVDIPCLAANIGEEYEAVVLLIAHETYHAIQHRFAMQPMAEFEEVGTLEQALDHMFAGLALEGSAAHIADMRQLSGEGRYTRFARDLARRNFRHLRYNFRLFDYMTEALVRDPEGVAERFPGIYGLAFDGAFGELGYYTGAQMAAEIEHSAAPAAIPCLLALPPENYVLAYAAALGDGDNLDASPAFEGATLDAARWLAARRPETADFGACLALG
ncbi:DUF5700 domain-containing putative Zn-dependent protease [Parasphingopyxis marina]|uniref:DUF2268 domain-containing protein n=1 Tax=Parasphingopyxis marina TaxID=2761622 RepID=A0A842HUT0_9SPHN|nr:DUF5700 domain-containing putative Zn-dependent protease [Parasphingopyxis marina]MBC2776141.1 hypothetical protein [Parasphingopyxis marina]